MIDYKADPKSKSMEFLIGGKITTEEYNKVINKFKKDIEKWDEVKVLELVEDIDGIEPMAFIKDLRFIVSQYGNINKKVTKCAVVADQKWIELMTKAASTFMDGEIKFFKPGEEAQAREWLGMTVH